MVDLLILLSDPTPEAENVTAGWIGFVFFFAGLVAVGLLGWSLVKQLRKVEDARKRGVYGDEPEVEETSEETPQA